MKQNICMGAAVCQHPEILKYFKDSPDISTLFILNETIVKCFINWNIHYKIGFISARLLSYMDTLILIHSAAIRQKFYLGYKNELRCHMWTLANNYFSVCHGILL